MNSSIKPDCLILDDDKNFRQIIKLRLNTISYKLNIIEKDSIASVKTYLKDHSPKLVFLDQHLPDGMGHNLLEEGNLSNSIVISLSSDESPELPVANLKAGARLFFQKPEVSRPFFFPMIEALIAREELEDNKRKEEEVKLQLDTVKTLIRTLQHEINNPLGAVIGSLYLLKSNKASDDDKKEAIKLLDESSSRIKSVLEKLGTALTLDSVEKGPDLLFHIPGDKNWEK